MTEPVAQNPLGDASIAEDSSAYESLFRGHPLPMIIFDVETFDILDVNAAAVRQYGFNHEQFTSLTIRDIRPPEDVPRLEKTVAKAGAGSYDAGEWRHRIAGGALIHVRVVTHPVRFRGRSARLMSAEDITTRKQSEAQLHLLSTAFHAAANATVITDRAGTIQWVNPAFTRMTGYEPDEAIGRNPGDLLRSGEHDDAYYEDLWTTVLDGGIWKGLTVNRRKDGSLYQEEQTITPVRGDGGAVTHFIAVKEEVTDRLAAEDALRRSEARYRRLFDGVPIGLLLTTPAGQMIDANKAAVRMLGGGDRDALLGRSVVDLYEDPEARARLVERINQEGHVYGLEVRLRTVDGRRIWASVSAAAERDEEGRVVHHESAVEDVTERRMKQDQLRFQAQLLAAVGDAVIATDTQGRIEHWNRRAEVIFGWTAEEVMGRDILEVTVPAGRREEAAALFERVLGGETWSGELEVARSDGTIVPTFVTDSPIYDALDRIIGVVGVSRDLTVERSLEHQLRHAQKMEALGRLAGGIAHDFNNVLTAIHGHTQFLLEELGPSSLIEDARVIQRSAERASQLTQQLLAFSRKQIRQPRVIDLGQAVRDMESLLRPILGEDVILSISASEDAGRIEADPGQLDQVVVNLAVNARDAMPDGGFLNITVGRVEREEFSDRVDDAVEPGPYMFVEVSDTGTGIDPDTLDHLFEPFFTTKAVGKGTGLGLSTVYGIVEQSGGRISVATRPGEGSMFRAYFPRVERPVSAPALPGTGPMPAGNGEFVLVVEDDDNVRMLVRRILERSGYRVHDFATPAAALDAISDPPDATVDLVITDVVMPEMNGVDMAERLLEIRPGLPVIFMSGYAEDEAVRRGMVDNRHRFIAKPFSAADLIALVTEALNDPAPPAPPPSR